MLKKDFSFIRIAMKNGFIVYGSVGGLATLRIEYIGRKSPIIPNVGEIVK
jgi:hypothetical protein